MGENVYMERIWNKIIKHNGELFLLLCIHPNLKNEWTGMSLVFENQ